MIKRPHACMADPFSPMPYQRPHGQAGPVVEDGREQRSDLKGMHVGRASYSQGPLHGVGAGGEGGSDEEEDGPVVVGFTEEADLMHDEMRSQLPMSFGEDGNPERGAIECK